MCYEKVFFRPSVTKKAQKLEESKPVIERAAATVQPLHSRPAPETKRPTFTPTLSHKGSAVTAAGRST